MCLNYYYEINITEVISNMNTLNIAMGPKMLKQIKLIDETVISSKQDLTILTN